MMKINHTFHQKLVSFILPLSLCLQSCGNASNQLMPTEGASISAVSRAPGTRVPGIGALHHHPWQGAVDRLPVELWTHILSYLGTHDIGMARQVHTLFRDIITDHIHNNRWVINEEQDLRGAVFAHIGTPFSPLQLKVQSRIIPRFVFKCLIRNVRNLPQNLWIHLQGPNVEMLDVSNNNMGDIDAKSFAQTLQNTPLHTLNLSNNRINHDWATTFVQNLPLSNHVHTLILRNNFIGYGDIGPFILNSGKKSRHNIKASFLASIGIFIVPSFCL